MKKLLSALVFTAFITFSLCGTEAIRIIGKTNKSALSYQKNEEMIFEFAVEFNGASSDGLFLKYIRKGDDGKTFSGQIPASEKLTVKTSLDRAGFVGVDVFLVNEAGKVQKSNGRDVLFCAGTAVEPETLKDCGEPEDFDEFWQAQRERLNKVPFVGLVEKVKVRSENNMDYYTVKIPCAGPRPVTGFLAIPQNAAPESLIAEVHFPGYGHNIQKCPVWALKDRITLVINAFGYELLQDDKYYKDYFNSIKSNGCQYAFDPVQNSDRDTAFFNGMALRVMRAMDYIKTVPEWNGKVLRAIGGSQGGLQTMWATALDKDITMSIPSITWCCDLAGQEKSGRCHGSWRIKHTPALDYYDPVFFAKRITSTEVYISRAGLGDYICPPSGLAVCYNNLATPRKKMVWVQGSTHGFIPVGSEVIVWESK